MEDISPTTIKNGFHSNGYPASRFGMKVPYNNNVPNVERIASELAIDISQFMCGMGKRPINQYASTMRRCVEDLLIKHEYLFNGMVKKLDVDMDNVELTLENVYAELFRDGAINWGRIVSVYTFAGRLAKHLAMSSDSKTKEVICKVSEVTGLIVASKLKKWIEQQGGWVCITFLLFQNSMQLSFF